MELKIKKYLAGKSTAREQKELLNWLRIGDHLNEFNKIKSEWKNEILKKDIPSEIHQNWQKIQSNINLEIESKLQKTKRNLNLFRYAAIFILLISIPTIIYLFQFKSNNQQLTYTTIVANFGQISKVILPDSTTIWVNSGSTLKYNNQFSSTNRDIELIGEAYFKVTKNKKLPLIVKSGDLNVKVLGTEFCVSAYPEEKNIQVILEKGKVRLSSITNSNFKYEIKPGEMANFNKEKNELNISNVNTNLYTSWKDGIINIYNLTLSELVNKLEKRYNQKFLVDEKIKDLHYTFTIKNENLSSVLNLMEQITPIDAIQKGNVIKLKYNKNKATKIN